MSQSIDTGPRATIRTIVASFLFTDLVGFSKGTAAEQYSAKAQLTALLRRDLAILRESDYWIKDTGDGALIAFVSNPEHALYVALALGHDYGAASGGDGATSNSLRTGLHLGTVKESMDLEGRRNFVGDGINAAKRIMDFAGPGQITASRSYFEAIANLDSAYAALFEHLGAPDDKHGRTHELYAVSRSDAVLEKLKSDLAAEAGEGPATEGSDAKAAVKPPTAASTRTAKPMSMMTIALLVVLGAASVFYFTSGREPAAPVARTAPEPTKPAESARPALESTKPATESATTAPTANPQPPRTSAQDGVAVPPSASAGDGLAGGASPPAPVPAPASPSAAVTKPASTTSPVVAPKQRPAAPPPAATPSGGTSDASSPRCSRIVEKAAVGEQLTQEEKRELATCR